MNKTAAFEAGIIYALEKDAGVIGRLLGRGAKEPFKTTAQKGKDALEAALAAKRTQKGALTQVTQRKAIGGGRYKTTKGYEPIEINGLTNAKPVPYGQATAGY